MVVFHLESSIKGRHVALAYCERPVISDVQVAASYAFAVTPGLDPDSAVLKDSKALPVKFFIAVVLSDVAVHPIISGILSAESHEITCLIFNMHGLQ